MFIDANAEPIRPPLGVPWSLDIFPEGDPSSSPGLLYSATLGNPRGEFANPNGVVTKSTGTQTNQGIGRRRIVSRVHCVFHVEQRLNPVGVAKIVAAIPLGS
jgi:hypothetical protein